MKISRSQLLRGVSYDLERPGGDAGRPSRRELRVLRRPFDRGRANSAVAARGRLGATIVKVQE